jgi:hypothetical protein
MGHTISELCLLVGFGIRGVEVCSATNKLVHEITILISKTSAGREYKVYVRTNIRTGGILG